MAFFLALVSAACFALFRCCCPGRTASLSARSAYTNSEAGLVVDDGDLDVDIDSSSSSSTSDNGPAAGEKA